MQNTALHRALPFAGLCALVFGATLFAGHAAAQGGPPPLGTVSEMSLPGGLDAALKAMGDRVPPDRSRFLIEVIQRVHDAVPGPRKSQGDQMLQALLSHLERAPVPAGVNGGPRNGNTNGDASDPTHETLPLPLSSAFWIDTVLAGRATPDSLAAAILRSRSASFLYYGLLSLDHETRAWFAAHSALISEITLRFPGAFVVAAPALRIAKQSVQVPGGDAAAAAWHALVGRRVDEPVEFVRALVTQSEGRLAHFFAALASLTPAQTAFALRLEAADPAARVDALRRLFAIFERNAAGWQVEERPFWRPRVDPALLVAELDADERGRPVLPGNRTFWTLVLTGQSHGKLSPDASTALSQNDAADFVWLCEQIFKGSQVVQRRPYEMVLFASRLLKNAPADQARHAIDAIRTASTYPALAAALERVHVSDLSVYTNAARRADRIAAIDDDTRAARALAQYQGSLALLTRAAARGTLAPENLASAITSLAAVETSDRGDYEGRLVRWLSATIAAHEHATKRTDGAASDPDATAEGLDERVLHFVSGPPARPVQVLEWEGTRYRLDFSRGEASRLSAMLGEHAQPYFSIAAALVAAAEALAQPAVTRDMLHEQAASIKKLSDGLREDASRHWTDSDGPSRLHAAATTLAEAAQSGSTREAARLAPTLRLIADDLLGRALVQLAYAVALGQPDHAPVSAGDAASRHDFGLRLLGFGRVGAWRYPVFGADRARDWRGSGSLLGLDLRLAQYALMPLSSRPPSPRPSMNDTDRRMFIETVVVQQPHRLTDAGGEEIVGVVARGRERVNAARTAADIGALADEIRLSPLRRTLLEWLAAHDADRVAPSFSRSELLWLGLEGKPLPPRFHAWGTSGEPRMGCDCPQLIDRRPWESFAGRWDSGILATIFADLNLRLVELLRELRMPATLLSHVLPAAALDFVNNVVSRWQDDHRALLAFVETLPIDRVEQYLALLTTNGPLVPVGGGSELSADSMRTEVRR